MRVPSIAVAINAAGIGSRLGMGINKSLIPICGTPILEWQLRIIPSDVPVILGVGFQADDVAAVAMNARDDVTIVFNHDYYGTGTAKTLTRSAQFCPDRVISLDGDLLVAESDLVELVYAPETTIGVLDPSTREPVFCWTEEHNGKLFATRLSRSTAPQGRQYEWSGLVNISSAAFEGLPDTGHVFEMLDPILPVRAVPVRCVEVDHSDDIPRAEAFVTKHLETDS